MLPVIWKFTLFIFSLYIWFLPFLIIYRLYSLLYPWYGKKTFASCWVYFEHLFHFHEGTILQSSQTTKCFLCWSIISVNPLSFNCLMASLTMYATWSSCSNMCEVHVMQVLILLIWGMLVLTSAECSAKFLIEKSC